MQIKKNYQTHTKRKRHVLPTDSAKSKLRRAMTRIMLTEENKLAKRSLRKKKKGVNRRDAGRRRDGVKSFP